MKNRNQILNSVDRRVRATVVYTEWVKRNQGTFCVDCGATENLELHHVTLLYHTIRDAYDFWKDEEETFKHVVDRHRDNEEYAVSLCQSCHAQRHQNRKHIFTDSKVHADTWAAIPRNFHVTPNHYSKEQRPGTIGLIAYLTMIGIGWHILHGDISFRMLTIHRRRFAKLIHKTPCTSFNKSLDNALDQLQAIGMIYQYHRKDNDIQIHIEQDYLDLLKKNPWFVPMKEINTDSMCVLALKMELLYQSRPGAYVIGLDKLKNHIGMTVKSKSASLTALHKAMKQISWAKMEVGDFLIFTKYGRAPTPIRRLREITADSIQSSER